MTTGGPFRSFIAVDAAGTPGVVDLLADLGASAGRGVKAVAPGNLHVTLRFLGPTAPEAVQGIREAMAAAADGVEPFPLHLRGVGTFPPRGAPRVLWIGLDGAGPLTTMAERLPRELERRGLPTGDDKPFRPHLTLARARRGDPHGPADLRAFCEAHRDADAGTVNVKDVRLVKSDLGPAGPTYSVVERVPLGA